MDATASFTLEYSCNSPFLVPNALYECPAQIEEHTSLAIPTHLQLFRYVVNQRLGGSVKD
jgi:hypothetical protein